MPTFNFSADDVAVEDQLLNLLREGIEPLDRLDPRNLTAAERRRFLRLLRQARGRLAALVSFQAFSFPSHPARRQLTKCVV